MTCSTNNSCSSKACRHTLLTWLGAILLAIYLYWHWQHGHGPAYATSCCAATNHVSAVIIAPKPIAAFSFTANASDGYRASTTAQAPAWASKSADLNAWLKGSADWAVAGDASHVTLTGTVDNEEAKLAKGAEAQAFFGAGVTVDNQLTVKAAVPAPAVVSAPAAAKLYFETGKTTLSADASQKAAPIIEWLKAHGDAKAVISGFHDARGSQAKNEEISKERAKSVRELLKSAGIDEARIEMRKPENTEGNGASAEARRVEVSIE